MNQSSHSNEDLVDISNQPLSDTMEKSTPDFTSCESIVSGKGRVSVLKKSSIGSLNSIASSSSCMRGQPRTDRSCRKEKHGVSFAIPYTDPGIYPRTMSNASTKSLRDISKNRDHLSNMQLRDTYSNHQSNKMETYSNDEIGNMDEFGIIVGVGSNSSIVSGTYSYDPVLEASVDSEIGTRNDYSTGKGRMTSEVDPWNVESGKVFVRRDTPPPKSVLPSHTDKDLRKLIKKNHSRHISMSNQALKRNKSGSAENLISASDGNPASLNSMEDIPKVRKSEINFESISIISATNLKENQKKNRPKTRKIIILNDESTYL